LFSLSRRGSLLEGSVEVEVSATFPAIFVTESPMSVSG